MKKLLFALTLSVLSMSAFAQQPHLKFKNLSIDGSVESFTEKLAADGFAIQEVSLNVSYKLLKGTFAGIEDCRIFVYGLSSKAAYEVEVNFPSSPANEGHYERLKKMYMYKYGKGVEETYYDVGMRAQRVRTIWSLSTGTILLYCGGADALVVKYTDAANAKLHYTGLAAYKDL